MYYLTFAGINTELRAIQFYYGEVIALGWWKLNFAHRYPDWIYDVVEERVVRR